ncbi:hypothetical protein [Novipirellula caenicola]|uniref:Bacterial membrane protein YfhO n=1 Tax=Novipirellula caenicola TaxID=1536901 RepID=A0ABP9VHS2_9BACT
MIRVSSSGLHRLVAPAIILLLFASVLVGIDRLAFRDVGHFYTPLYDYIGHRTDHQWLPLWNPLDQTGIPLVGETTTAVFYPVRWILFRMPIQTGTAIGWYVVIHLILAAITTRYAARRTGASEITASIAGLSYSLSGSVLVLYTNPPFLVGAAWLPLLMSTLIQRRPMPQSQRVMIAGTAMAMMILAGDPQTVANVVIVAMVVGCGRWALSWIVPRSNARTEGRTENKGNVVIAERSTTIVAVVASCLLASLLTLPQLAASVSWSAQSDRVLPDENPHWLAPPLLNSRRGQAYQFSVAPWHVAECLTPNAFGSLLPQYRRLSSLIPGDGRIWTPSVYMGLLVAIAFLSTTLHLARRRKNRKPTGDVVVWLGITLAASLVCLGHFGPVWMIQNATGGMAQTDSGTGGLYWMLYHVVPGYDSLRYPAKWLPIAAFAASMVTVHWLENLPRYAASTWRALMAIATVMVIALFVVIGLQYDPDRWLDNRAALPSDPFWGPLDIAGGLGEVCWSVVHSIIVLACITWVLMQLHRHRLSRATAMRCVLGIVVIDLAVFATSNIARVSANPTEIQSIPIADAGVMTLRTRTGSGWPDVWQNLQEADRLTEVEISSEIAWFGRWHLADRGHVFNNMTSIRSQAMAMFWKATREVCSTKTEKERAEFWAAVSQWLGIEQTINATETSRVAEDLNLVETQISRTPPAPAVQIHHSWSIRDSATTSSEDFSSLLQKLGDANRVPRIYMDALEAQLTKPSSITEPSITWVIKQESADAFEIEVNASTTCLLERTVYQDGHWHATLVSSNPSKKHTATVHRVDYLKQGVIVPPGRWIVTFEYRPWWMMPSIIAAIAGWLTMLTYWGRRSGWLLRRHAPSSR